MNIELIILLVLPIVLSLPIYLLGRKNTNYAKWGTVVISAGLTIFTFLLWVGENVKVFGGAVATRSEGFYYLVNENWIPSVGITFSLGIDGLSLPLLLLTQVVFLVSIISAFYIHDQEASFYAMILVLMSGVTGTFIALDMFLFYIAWELVLVPMFFLIHIWGGENRRYAAIKFFIYTHLASLVMLIGLFLIYIYGYDPVTGDPTFYLPALKANLAQNFSDGNVSLGTLNLIFWLVFIGFVTKFPQVPVHTWLPDAHVQAPSPGSSILAGLLLKMGGYGLLRIPFWLFGDVKTSNGTGFFETNVGLNIRYWIAVIGMISMAYPAFIALRQDDLKKMIAYSSISHMGIVLLGLAAYNSWGINGAVFMMIAHGVISPGLFLLSGIVEHNTKSHTRLMSKVGGLAHKMPFTGGLFVFLGFASAGLPGLAGFVAEFTTFVGLFTSDLFSIESGNVWIPVIAVMSIIVTAGYYLWAIQRVIFNEPTEELDHATPAKWWEILPILTLSALTLLLGLIPGPIWAMIDFFSKNYVLPA